MLVNTPVQRLEDNVKRYGNSLVIVEAARAQDQRDGVSHTVVLTVLPSSTSSTLTEQSNSEAVSLCMPGYSALTRGTQVRAPMAEYSRLKRYSQDQVQSAARYVAYGKPFSGYLSFAIMHLGVSFTSPLDPVDRRSRRSFCCSWRSAQQSREVIAASAESRPAVFLQTTEPSRRQHQHTFAKRVSCRVSAVISASFSVPVDF